MCTHTHSICTYNSYIFSPNIIQRGNFIHQVSGFERPAASRQAIASYRPLLMVP